ncbi:hypothetical protein SNEBB_007641 [Seison nebaliae]|nr:hypothetical protein SNEBB_007641 [Seison nebaliae]
MNSKMKANIIDNIDKIKDAVLQITHTPMRLRDLIRQIRSAKTASEERQIVQKESAFIRDSFRTDTTWRCRNLAKLLYIHMLGYEAHFGQMPAINLVASTRFTDKRIGYLATTLLLDENQEVHVLVTNSLKNDLNSSNQYVAALALSTFASICSPSMCRELTVEIEKLIKSNNSYLKKKALLCATRMIRKLPELVEYFLPITRTLLLSSLDKSHGVLISSISLLIEMCRISQDILFHFRQDHVVDLTPTLLSTFRNLLISGFSPEYDVGGIADPFLQVSLLRLLGYLGANDGTISDLMTDILAEVATNTDSSKNVGNAILYETVLVIMKIDSDETLRVLAINILGRFLLNADKNIRYIALNTLLKLVHVDMAAVQRHRSTIVDCLREADVSIKKRAMELSFALINDTNAQLMTKEMLRFQRYCEDEFKFDCTSNLYLTTERYAIDDEWRLNTLIKMFDGAGNNVREDILSSTISFISSIRHHQLLGQCTLDLFTRVQRYMESPSKRKLLNGTEEKKTNSDDDVDDDDVIGDVSTVQPLVIVTLWCIGQYVQLLLVNSKRINEREILNLIELVLRHEYCTIQTKEFALTTLMKVSVLFNDDQKRISLLINQFGQHLHLELQQRSIEYQILHEHFQSVKNEVFKPVPPEENQIMSDGNYLSEGGTISDDNLIGTNSDLNQNTTNHVDDTKNDLNDLFNLTNTQKTNIVPAANQDFDIMELLNISEAETSKKANDSDADILSELNDMYKNRSHNISKDPSPNVLSDDLFSQMNLNKQENKIRKKEYNSDGLTIDFEYVRTSDSTITVETFMENNSNFDLTSLSLMFAGTAPTRMEVSTPSSTSLRSNNGDGIRTQSLHLSNATNASPLKLRVKLLYKTDELSEQISKIFITEPLNI